MESVQYTEALGGKIEDGPYDTEALGGKIVDGPYDGYHLLQGTFIFDSRLFIPASVLGLQGDLLVLSSY